jgi:lipid-A-disaccharide synthase
MAAGEVSGDRQAAHLAHAMLRMEPHLRLYGTGGEMMRQAGVDIVRPTAQYGSVGLQESLRFVRPLRRVMAAVKELVQSDPPDLAVLVDNEGFNAVLSRVLHRQGIPFIYYFPPQVWLWGEWRASSIAKSARAILPAFRQEAEIYTREGGTVHWFGHPLLDVVRPDIEPAQALRMIGLDPTRDTIAIMPGSRFQEIEHLAEPMIAAAHHIRRNFPDIQVVLPVAAPHLLDAIQQKLHTGNASESTRVVHEHVYSTLKACRLAILSSGTATLETALLGVPMIAAYKVSAITYTVARRLVKVPFIAMPNILTRELIVPELIQQEVTAENIASTAIEILKDGKRSDEMREKLSGIRHLLGPEGALTQLARRVLEEARSVRRPSAA